jgi:exonuclease III
MKNISNSLDDLIEESNNTAEQVENKEIIVRHKKCDHAPIIANLKDELDQK